MSSLVLLWNVAAWIGYAAAVFVVARRPAERWRAGRVGKTVSILGVLVVAFHVGPWLVPFGGVVAVARHRRPLRQAGNVPLAETWPGQQQ